MDRASDRSGEVRENERGSDASSLVRHEEEARIGKEWQSAGHVHARKTWETHEVSEQVPRRIESIEGMERQPVHGEDSGQIETLPDGSISIPVMEEELVITRRMVVKERVIIRKQETVREETVRAELARERVDIETEGNAEVTGDVSPPEQQERNLPPF